MLAITALRRGRTGVASSARCIHQNAAAHSRHPKPHKRTHAAASPTQQSQVRPAPQEELKAHGSKLPDAETSTPLSGSASNNTLKKRDRVTIFEDPYLLDTSREVRQGNLTDPATKRKLENEGRSATPTMHHRVQYNRDPFSLHPREDHFHYPSVTADDLAKNKERPKGVRMLAREFIHDSLYHPFYGYFSRQAVLLPHFAEAEHERKQILQGEVEPPSPMYQRAMQELAPLMGTNGEFRFGNIKNEDTFTRALSRRYQAFEEKAERIEAIRAYEVVARRNAVIARQLKEKNLPPAELAKRLKDLDLMLEASKFKSANEFVRSRGYRAETTKGIELARAWGRAAQVKTHSDELQEPDVMAMAARQVWHTPTELFKPYFAEGLARYLVNEYKMGLYPYEDLVIYEIGAGSGALAEGILTYLQDHEPQVYSRTRYGIIEISSRLAQQQQQRLQKFVNDGRVEVHKKDVLQWGQPVHEPCFVVALEVFDNLAHDAVRYDAVTLEPYQGIVSIDEEGDFEELWEPVQDPTIKRYLRLLADISDKGSKPFAVSPATAALPWYGRYLSPRLRKSLAEQVPFWPNLTQAHYIPTAALQLLDNLKAFFPQHRLVMSDFNYLPDTIGGRNAPVVQTRLRGESVAVSKLPVLQGFFDIFFPTNFDELKAIYMEIVNTDRPLVHDGDSAFNSFSNAFYYSSATGRLPGQGVNPRILSQAEFIKAHADIQRTALADGTNPMLSWYRNVSWFLT